MIIQNRSRSSYFLVRKCARRIFREKSRRWKILIPAAAMGGAAAIFIIAFLPPDRIKMGPSRQIFEKKTEYFINPTLEIKDRIPEAETLNLDSRMAPDDISIPSRIEPDAVLVVPEVAAEPEETEKILKEAPVIASVGAADQEPPETEMIEKEVPITVSVNTAVQEARDELVSQPTHAAILGRITLKRKETLSRIIRQVYGGFNSKYLKAFVNANPDIQNPDRVAVGQIISLPAIPIKVSPGDNPLWWIKVDETDTLETAFKILRNHPGSFPRVKLIPYWNPETGSKFAVVLDQLFNDEKSARTQQEKLPAALSSGSTILSHWEKKTVFFANPYSDQSP